MCIERCSEPRSHIFLLAPSYFTSSPVTEKIETEEQGRRYNTRKRGHDQTLHSVKPTKTRKPSEPRSAGKPASTGPKLRLSVGDTIWHQGQQCVVLQKMKQSGVLYNYVNLKPAEGEAYQADLQRTEFTRVEKVCLVLMMRRKIGQIRALA